MLLKIYASLLCFSYYMQLIKSDEESQFFAAQRKYQLFPYGVDEGDERYPAHFDGHAALTLKKTISIHGKPANIIFINENGVISFKPFGDYDQASVNLTNGESPNDEHYLIIPFFTDIQITSRRGDNLFYRVTSHKSIIKRAHYVLKTQFSEDQFKPDQVVVVTWSDVTGFGLARNYTNTFQCLLISNKDNLVIVLQYEHMYWFSTEHYLDGGRSGDGIGGRSATIGLRFPTASKKIDANNYLTTLSNTQPQMPGRYIFRIKAGHDGQIFEPKSSGLVQCMLYGDPHIKTWDDHIYSVQHPPDGEVYFLAAEYKGDKDYAYLPWKIWFRTENWYDLSGLTVVNTVRIDIYHEPKFGKPASYYIAMDGLLKYGNMRIPPEKLPMTQNLTTSSTVRVGRFGLKGHMIYLEHEKLRISFSGTSDHHLAIQLPKQRYHNKIGGYCGTLNDDPTDDDKCSGGIVLEGQNGLCFADPDGWDPSRLTNLSSSGLQIANIEQCPSEAIEICDITIHLLRGPFRGCNNYLIMQGMGSGIQVLKRLHRQCKYDICPVYHINRDRAELSNLKCTRYSIRAALCPNDEVLDWMTETGCSVTQETCPKDREIDARAPICAETCETMLKGASDAFCNSDISTIDCVCKDGFVLDPKDSEKCIPVNTCGCLSASGLYYAVGEKWTRSDCRLESTCFQNSRVFKQDLAECSDNALCMPNETTRESHICRCKTGFNGDGRTCSQTDPCFPNPCTHNQTCVQKSPSEHECQCTGGECATLSKNPCADRNPCPGVKLCFNFRPFEFACHCPTCSFECDDGDDIKPYDCEKFLSICPEADIPYPYTDMKSHASQIECRSVDYDHN